MKIVHFITSLKMGGAETALYNSLVHPENQHHQHSVITLYDGPIGKKIADAGIPIYHLSGMMHRYDPFLFTRLYSLIKKLQPDVLHTALWSANLLGRLIGHLLNIPIVCDLHGQAANEGTFRNIIDRHTLGYADAFIAVSETVAHGFNHVLANKSERSPATNLETIRNGIDVLAVHNYADKHHRTRNQEGLAQEHFVIGSVGRLEPIKSYHILIEAFAQLYEANPTSHNILRLFIVGNGSQRTILEALTHRRGIAHAVTFAGERSDAQALYQLFDCFVLSSQSEGLSIALLEALCFELPLVSTHNNPTHDVINHNQNGLLVPANNVQALAQALNKLFHNPLLRISMENYNKNLIATYDLSNNVKKYNNLYRLLKKTDYKKNNV